ncbi:F-box protein [Rhizoctonia solani]|uniref:F-box protein n=1 Tax=Rhizoctonia solani TaxID=456999 RepID=A0A8H8T1X9_9AGAM|nr:F-box protein [Rhizoctonia solani]QRW24958.1 F-box protein [Rhizoctonia solani]
MKELLTYAQNANPTEEPGKSSKDDGSELIVTDSLNELEGALRGVIGLPIEILIEVLGYLALPDTLALSRSSKFFRRILMNPTAATLNVWRASIENVPGLPSCPKDLSEPQYAALIYSHHCTVCGTSTSEPMDPYLNTRLCQDCIEKNIVAAEDIKDEVVGVLIPQSPISRLKGGGCCTKTCLRRDKEAMEAWYKELHQRQLSRKEIRSEIGQIGDNLVERVLASEKLDTFPVSELRSIPVSHGQLVVDGDQIYWELSVLGLNLNPGKIECKWA